MTSTVLIKKLSDLRIVRFLSLHAFLAVEYRSCCFISALNFDYMFDDLMYYGLDVLHADRTSNILMNHSRTQSNDCVPIKPV